MAPTSTNMVKLNFTAGRVAEFTCQASRSQSIYWDAKTPGLGLRVTRAGNKAYVFESRVHGKTVRMTIGDPRTWTVAAAQAEATRLKVLTDQGVDPRAVVKASKEQAIAQELSDRRAGLTLGDVWPVYIEARRQRWSEWHIRDHLSVAQTGGDKKKRGAGETQPGPLASLLPLRLPELTGPRIAAWLSAEAIERPARAALAFRLLSVFVNWCKGQPQYAGLIPDDAIRSRTVLDELPRIRTKEHDCLQREHLKPWFSAVRSLENPVQAAYLQVLLLTGARRRELGGLRWPDIDFTWAGIELRDKVDGTRIIPLTPYVAHLLSSLPRRNEWVFSSETSATGQLVEPTPAHKKALAAAGLPDMTLHGLRRSFGTLAEWVEVPTGIVAQVMGHAPSAIAERHYKRRPLDLLRLWHIKIEEWILDQAGIEYQPSRGALELVHSR